MIRLAVPIILLILMLLGGTWYFVGTLEAPDSVQKPSAKERQAAARRIELPSPGAKPADSGASFDIARINPNGTSVFAGRAEPGSNVTVLGDGKALGTARADENGEWTLATEEKLASTDPKLELKTKSAADVAKERAEQTRLAALSPQPTPIPPDARSANAVTQHLLKDLEGMVKDARSGASPPTVAAGTPAPPSSLAAPEPPAEPGVRKSVPVPITFVFNEPTLTPEGRQAAALLLEYLRLKHYARISLTGHADERGSDELNMALSKERLDTVASFLKAGGYTGELELIPKGKREPFSGVVRSQYPLDELYQLDRRVELLVTQ